MEPNGVSRIFLRAPRHKHVVLSMRSTPIEHALCGCFDGMRCSWPSLPARGLLYASGNRTVSMHKPLLHHCSTRPFLRAYGCGADTTRIGDGLYLVRGAIPD